MATASMGGARPAPPMTSAWRWFALGLAATLAGFWPSFFSRPFDNALPQLLHGIACTAWLLLLLAQALLYRTRRLALHRMLGWSSVLLMPVVLGTGAWVLHLMLVDGGQSKLPMPLARMLGFIDTGTLLFLLAAWSLGMARRHRMPEHALDGHHPDRGAAAGALSPDPDPRARHCGAGRHDPRLRNHGLGGPAAVDR
jgi:uncharacterized membrane protein